MANTDLLVLGGAAVVHSAAANAVATSWANTTAFVDALWASIAGSGTEATRKTRRDKTLKDLKAAVATDAKIGGDLARAAAPLQAVAAAVGRLGAALITPGPGSVTDSVNACVEIVTKLGEALDLVAAAAAQGDEQKRDDIASMFEILTDPVRDAGPAVGDAFVNFCEQAFGWDTVRHDLVAAGNLIWDRSTNRLETSASAKVGAKGSLGPIAFDGVTMTAFLDARGTGNLGVRVETKMAVGLRGDPMLHALIPGEKPTDSTQTAITFDTKGGLTFSDGTYERVVLPARLRIAGVELRELSLSNPDAKANLPSPVKRMDIEAVLAAKFGAVLAFVAEGGGVRLVSATGGGWMTEPLPPTGLGFAIRAGPVSGGGFLRHREAEGDYGGIVNLSFGPVGVTAAAVVSPTPFSFVAVMGMRFKSAIDLSFGFTLNGVGGLVAIDRALSVDAFGAALKDGVVSNLLFPIDPVASAPTILNQLATVFPASAGSLVVGPIAEIGWGSQAGLVRAKVGVLLSLPDPAISIIGSVQVQVPPPEARTPKVVDLKLDVFTHVTPEEFYLRASLYQSSIAGLAVSGDFGLLARWSGSATFALSAGGFFPRFPAPDRMKDLRRIALAMSPPFPGVKLNATAYFALTGNSVQLGGLITLEAKVGPVRGTGELGLDALFEWSPQLRFTFRVHASVAIKWKSHTIAGASFDGSLTGATPWTLHGHASVSILFWDVNFNVGPWTWGDHAPDTAKVSALEVAQRALEERSAWSARSGDERPLAILRSADPDLLLLEPLAVVRVTQGRVPFETAITRVGPNPTDDGRLDFGQPAFLDNAVPVAAPAFGPVVGDFAPGQFLTLNAEEQMTRPAFEQRPSGVELAGCKGVRHGAEADAQLLWETFYPHADKGVSALSVPWSLKTLAPAMMATGPVEVMKVMTDFYNPVVNPAEQFRITDQGSKDVVGTTGMAAVGSLAISTSEAMSEVVNLGGALAGVQAVTSGLAGVMT